MKWFAIITLILVFALTGCEGEKGPAGPQGPPGPGSRIVYQATNVIPDSPNPYCVIVPEIDLDDMPVVSVYLSLDRDEWIEIPVYFDALEYSVAAAIEEGEICLLNCVGWYYMIVIVI